MAEVMSERMYKYWLTFDPIFKMTNLYKIVMKHGYERDNTLSDYLIKPNEEMYQGSLTNGVKGKLGTISDLLYNIRGQTQYKEIKSEVDTMLAAV